MNISINACTPRQAFTAIRVQCNEKGQGSSKKAIDASTACDKVAKDYKKTLNTAYNCPNGIRAMFFNDIVAEAKAKNDLEQAGVKYQSIDDKKIIGNNCKKDFWVLTGQESQDSPAEYDAFLEMYYPASK